MKNKITTIFLAMTLALFSLSTMAQVLLIDDFNHAAGTALNTVGWNAHSAGSTNPILVGGTGLSLAGTAYLGNGVGGSALVSNTGSDENKPFASSVDSGTVYAAMLVNLSYLPTASTGGFFFHLGQYGNPTTPVYTTLNSSFRARLYVAPGDPGKYKMGLTYSSSVVPTTGLSDNLDTGITYLVVVKYAIIPGAINDIISAYVLGPNANLSAEPAVPTMGPFTADNTETSSLQCVVLRQFNAAQRIAVDGIRVQRDWAFAPVSCPVPQMLTTTAVDTTSASIQWSVSGTAATSWLVQYGPTGFVVGTGTSLSVSSTTASLTGLSGSTSYDIYIRSLCLSGGVTDTSVYSAPFTITTPGAQIPTVSTVSAVSTGLNQASLSGQVVADGGLAVTQRGFAWGTQPVPVTTGAVAAAGTGLGAFTATLSNLALNTTYYVRSYATNLIGTAYGAELSFVTPTISRAVGAATALVEDFDYPAGSLLRNNGWSVHSGGSTNPIAVSGNGLGWNQTPYYGSNVGGAAQVVNTGADENKNFATWLDSGSVYASFLLKGNSTNTNSRGYFFHFAQYDSVNNPVFTSVNPGFRARTYITQGSTAANFRLGLAFNSATVPATPGVDVTSDLDTSSTYLVVVKYAFVPGDSNDLVSLYVFADGDNISQEPAIPTLGPFGQTPNTTTFLASPDADVLQGVVLRQYNAAQRIVVDGIRVRNFWDLTAQAAGGTLTGLVRYGNNAQTALNNSTVLLKNALGATVATATSGSNGSFSMNNVVPGSYTLEASTTKPWGGVTASDALLAVRHATGAVLQTGLRLVACDVNGNAAVNSGDALLINRRFSGSITTFSVGSWYFEQPAVTVTSGALTQNISAICYGDVNASYSPVARGDAGLVLVADQATAHHGALPLALDRDLGLGSLSLELNVPAGVRVTGIRSLIGGDLSWNVANGKVRLGWFSAEEVAVQAGQVAFVVESEITRTNDVAGHEWTLGSVAEATDAWAVNHPQVGLRIPSLAAPKAAALVAPQPVNQGENIRLVLNLDRAATLQVEVRDLLGRSVRPLRQISAGAGAGELSLEGLSSGRYSILVTWTDGSGQRLNLPLLVR